MKSPELQPGIYEDLSIFVASKKESGDKLVDAYNDKILDIYSVGLNQKIEEIENAINIAQDLEELQSKAQAYAEKIKQIKAKQLEFNQAWQEKDKITAQPIRKEINKMLAEIDLSALRISKEFLKNHIDDIAKKLQIESKVFFDVKDDLTVKWDKKTTPENITKIITQPNNFVRKIDLTSNNLKVNGVGIMVKALKHENNKVTSIDLYSNYLEDDGADILAEALMHANNKVTSIDLTYNQIGMVGAKRLAEALKHENNKVISINLSSNEIEDIGTQSLANALKDVNNKVKSISLYDNKIGNAGMHSLAIALQNVNNKITSINLEENKYDHKSYIEIESVINQLNRKVELITGYLT